MSNIADLPLNIKNNNEINSYVRYIEYLRRNPGILREWLRNYYRDMEDFKNLCQNLTCIGVDYDSLEGMGLGKARALAGYLAGRDSRLKRLFEHLKNNDSESLEGLIKEISRNSYVE
ncbi:hypothetical protein GTQ43_39060 [Nostoc sp. KVJ3]|uniref:hypothetical protein n=1 Tax=Nostoc sp. KVJ3 TaxID=457945 RepID=UPI0022388770|nr:hypothetical protein [Nostoc sp. KVJ3]MCW5319357.1 hypothetical protein [Nostoc sp. KVJ3]